MVPCALPGSAAATQATRPKHRILQQLLGMSGFGGLCFGDKLQAAVEAQAAAGIMMVAARNSGSGCSTVSESARFTRRPTQLEL